MKHNKLFLILALAAMVIGGASCKKYLEKAFPNPNKPTIVEPEVAWPSIITIMPRGVMFDSRFMNRYVQYWAHTTGSTTWDMMGYDPGSDNGSDQWRTHYYSFGQNLLNIINQGRASNRPAFSGAGYALFAWSWMVLTDQHGEVILKEAFHADQLTFNYDTQPEVYAYALQLTDSALMYLNQAKAMTPATTFTTADAMLYGGDVDKWLKFTYGVRAMLYHRYIKKPEYNADSVINNIDRSFTSNADNATIKFIGPGTFTEQLNFYGPTRNNMGVYRQCDFFVNMLNGTVFPGAPDPRLGFLFKPSQDGIVHGLTIAKGETPLAATARPPTFWGQYATTGAPSGGVDTGARHFFKNLSPFPVITYPELQFIKAEAAMKKGATATAYTAFMNGVNGAFDLLTTTGLTGYTPIAPADRAAYLANTNAVPATAAGLTVRHIILQKYISMYPYGAEEAWVDMRRFAYDPAIYTGFAFPSPFYTDNAGKPAYRVRPRYNSEYLWNVDALNSIGAIAPDYHTKVPWFAQ